MGSFYLDAKGTKNQDLEFCSPHSPAAGVFLDGPFSFMAHIYDRNRYKKHKHLLWAIPQNS